MPEALTRDIKLSLPAIVVGALTAFLVSFTFLLVGTGLAVGIYHIDRGQNLTPLGTAVGVVFLAARALASAAAGGYVAGYFSPQRNAVESRTHGFAAFALASILMTFYLASLGASGLKSFLNTSTSLVSTSASTPLAQVPPAARDAGTVQAPVVFRFATGSSYLAFAVFTVAGAAASFWAGGAAYAGRTRRRDSAFTADERRAA